MTNEAKIQEILKRRGLDVSEESGFADEVIPEPSPRFTKLINIYYAMKNTIDMEYPYWYNRVWWENDGDITEIRRAKAEAAALSHMTPTILPGELLFGNKTRNFRGAFCFPWVDASFFNAAAEAMMAGVDAPLWRRPMRSPLSARAAATSPRTSATSFPSRRSSVCAVKRSPALSSAQSTGTTALSSASPHVWQRHAPTMTSGRATATPSSSCSTPGRSRRAVKSSTITCLWNTALTA